jgi:hypothetical protein
MDIEKKIDRRGEDLPSNRINGDERKEFARLWEAATGEVPSSILGEIAQTDGEHDPDVVNPSPEQSILKDREGFTKIWEAVTGQRPNAILAEDADDAGDADLFKDTGVEIAARKRSPSVAATTSSTKRDSQSEIKLEGTSG